MPVIKREKKGLQPVGNNRDNTRVSRQMAESTAAARLQATLNQTHDEEFYGLVTIEVYVEAGRVKRVRESVARTTPIQ